jgi:hypothetical protein
MRRSRGPKTAIRGFAQTPAIRTRRALSPTQCEADRLLDGVLKDAGRNVAAKCLAYLHVTGGLTLPRLKALCASTGLVSSGRARMLLIYLQHLGYARPAQRREALDWDRDDGAEVVGLRAEAFRISYAARDAEEIPGDVERSAQSASGLMTEWIMSRSRTTTSSARSARLLEEGPISRLATTSCALASSGAKREDRARPPRAATAGSAPVLTPTRRRTATH